MRRALLIAVLLGGCSDGLTIWDLEGQWTLTGRTGPAYYILFRRVGGGSSCDVLLTTYAGHACADIAGDEIHTGTGRLCLSSGCAALIPADTNFRPVDEDTFTGKVQQNGVIEPAVLQRYVPH